MTGIKYGGAIGDLLVRVCHAANQADNLIPNVMALFFAMAADGLVTFTAMASGTMKWTVAYVGDDGETLTTTNLAGGIDDHGRADDSDAVYLIPCRPGTASAVAAAWKVAAATWKVAPADGVDLTTADGAAAHVSRSTGQPVTDRTNTAIAGPATRLLAAGRVKIGAAGLDKTGQVRAVPGTLRHEAAAAVTGKTSTPTARKVPTGQVWSARQAVMAADVPNVDWSAGDLDVAVINTTAALAALQDQQTTMAADPVDDLSTLDGLTV